MSRHGNKNQNVTTEEPVVKEDSTTVVAEETAEQTPEPESVNAEEKAMETLEEDATAQNPEVEEEPEESGAEEAETLASKEEKKIVAVTCDKLYIRPEPNKKADIGVLVKGTKLIVDNTDAKLPEGWLHVTVEDKSSVVGYVMAEYVK